MGKKIVSFFLSVSVPVFSVTSDAPLLTLTEQEKAYFSELQTLRVMTVPNVQPYAYENSVHMELERGTLRISLTPQELDEMLQQTTLDHSYQIELQCGMKEGNWNWFRLIYIVVCTTESHRRPIRLIGCLVDIEEERREKERLLKIGYRDQLTDLLNRVSGENEIKQALDSDISPKVLLFLDIDYFKLFNDHHGHSCGDAVLNALGDALRGVFSKSDAILCCSPGDEFILLVSGEGAEEQKLYACLRALQEKMRAFAYMGESLPVTLSIGSVTASPHLTFQAIFELADATLCTVKDKGRNHFLVVSPMERRNGSSGGARE